MRTPLLSAVLWMSWAVALAGCGPRPLELVRAPALQSTREHDGERVYMRFCNGCHPAGLGGLGPGIINKPLPAWAMKFQIRNGLGAMPSFSEQVISSDELDALIDYIRALRRDRPAE